LLLEILSLFFSNCNIIEILTDLYFTSSQQNLAAGQVTLVIFYSSLLWNSFLVPFKYLIVQLSSLFSAKLITSAIVSFAIKFILLIALLIFVRGGIPRYRYDFLTKVGWIKFLSLILSIFLSSLLLIFLF